MSAFESVANRGDGGGRRRKKDGKDIGGDWFEIRIEGQSEYVNRAAFEITIVVAVVV